MPQELRAVGDFILKGSRALQEEEADFEARKRGLKNAQDLWAFLSFEDTLSPCPFCGGKAKISLKHQKQYVQCVNDECRASMVRFNQLSDDTHLKLRDLWNKRK